jgi:hypothetical protein
VSAGVSDVHRTGAACPCCRRPAARSSPLPLWHHRAREAVRRVTQLHPGAWQAALEAMRALFKRALARLPVRTHHRVCVSISGPTAQGEQHHVLCLRAESNRAGGSHALPRGRGMRALPWPQSCGRLLPGVLLTHTHTRSRTRSRARARTRTHTRSSDSRPVSVEGVQAHTALLFLLLAARNEQIRTRDEPYSQQGTHKHYDYDSGA